MNELLSDVLEGLNVALFERRGSVKFQAVGRIPPWCQLLFCADGNSQYDLATESPFLENFLIDAEPFWRDSGRSLRSSWR